METPSRYNTDLTAYDWMGSSFTYLPTTDLLTAVIKTQHSGLIANGCHDDVRRDDRIHPPVHTAEDNRRGISNVIINGGGLDFDDPLPFQRLRPPMQFALPVVVVHLRRRLTCPTPRLSSRASSLGVVLVYLVIVGG